MKAFKVSSKTNLFFVKDRTARTRRRQILYLILDFLREENLNSTVNALISEAKLDGEFVVCDNVDLDIILREYCDYFQLRFDKSPQICKTELTNPKLYSNEVQEKEETIQIYSPLISDCKLDWDHVKGAEDAKTRLKEALTSFEDFPHLFPGGKPPWRGVLLHGPPGNGKTTLAKIAAAVSGRTFLEASPSTLLSKWRGESEKAVESLFESARKSSPSIIFLDEADSLVSTRGKTEEHEASRRLKAQLLMELDDRLDGVLFLAASNLPWDIDEALLRRMEKRILVGLPDLKSRLEILRSEIVQSNSLDVNLEDIAVKTEGYSGSDLCCLCKEAKMEVVRRTLKNGTCYKSAKILQEDLYLSINKIKPCFDLRLNLKHLEWNKRYGAE